VKEHLRTPVITMLGLLLPVTVLFCTNTTGTLCILGVKTQERFDKDQFEFQAKDNFTF
jgi:hypothetical protein